MAVWTPTDATPSDPVLDAVVQKVVWRLIPILFVSYCFNYLDRVNVSFAKLQMGQALGLDDAAFGLGAGMFFVGYFFFEIPSNLILERVGARLWIARIMVTWGLVNTAMAFVTTPMQFYVMRFMIGFAEAGFFPGIVLYLTYWIPPAYRGRIMALFMSSLAVSGILGGPFSGAVMQWLDGAWGLVGWQWLMLLTGLPCVLLAVFVWAILTDRPAKADWLSKDEKATLSAALAEEQGVARTGSPLAALRNFYTWSSAFIYFLLVCGGYGMSFWMPTILAKAGMNSFAEIGLLTAIPNIAGIIAMTLIGRRSDARQERRWHLTFCFVLAAMGFAIVANQIDSIVGTVLGLSIASMGILSALPLSWTVPTRMLSHGTAAVGIAIITSLGNLGGFVSPVVIGKISVATGSTANGFVLLSAILALGAIWVAISVRMPRT
jgi:sugar phosphate permease